MNTLREAVRTYLDMRRGLGFKLRDAGRALIDFVAFLERHHASYITQSLALAWAQQPAHTQPAHWAQRLSFVRGFARYRSATDPRTQIPPQGLLPFRPKRARPFLYSDDNIRSLLRAALRMECHYEGGKLRPWVYSCLFGLLSVSGLRLGEACNLELQDVDLKAAVLTIRGAKFGKDRFVPLHRSTCAVLAKYIARIHDLRHRFATMTLLRWYRSGEDVERRLPFLSAYLGHVHISDTFWYLSAWPELMQQAMARLERCWEGQS